MNKVVVVSDSETFLFEKVAKEKNIYIEEK